MTVADGYPIAAEARDLELYQLLCEVAASPRIAELASHMPRLARLRAVFEASEVSRRLIAVAVTSRSVMDAQAGSQAVARVSEKVVGLLAADVEKGTHDADLTFREACNKVIHAQSVTLHETADGPLLRLVALLGYKSGVCWAANLDILAFLDAAHDLP